MRSIAAQPPVIVILGPTASGKSELALAVAKKIGAEIISADSRQIYRELDIGAAKPSAEALQEVTHHFVNEKNMIHLNVHDKQNKKNRHIQVI